MTVSFFTASVESCALAAWWACALSTSDAPPADAFSNRTAARWIRFGKLSAISPYPLQYSRQRKDKSAINQDKAGSCGGEERSRSAAKAGSRIRAACRSYCADHREPKVTQLRSRPESRLYQRQCNWRAYARSNSYKQNDREKHQPIGKCRINRHGGWTDHAELRLIGTIVGRLRKIGGLAPFHQLIVIFLDDVVIAVHILRLGGNFRQIAAEGLRAVVIIRGFVKSLLEHRN